MDPKASRRALEKAAASGSMFPKLKDVINCAYFQSLPNMKEYVRSSAFEVEKCTTTDQEEVEAEGGRHTSEHMFSL